MALKLRLANRLKRFGSNQVKIAIIAAIAEELAPFRAAYETMLIWAKGRTIIEKVHDNLFLVESGIGKANAAATTAWLCEIIQPDFIINTGTAGTFQTNIPLGSVIYSPEFMYSDVDATGFGYDFGQIPQMPPKYVVSEKLLTQIEGIFFHSKIAVIRGNIVTADSFMSDSQLIATVRRQIPKLIA